MRNILIFISSLTFSFFFIIFPVYAQEAELSKPDIQTYNTATSSTVIIKSPSGYKSRVVSTYDGNQFNTVATSTPLTSEDIQEMQDRADREASAMQKIFEDQTALWSEQEKMLQNIWGDDFGIVAPIEKVQKQSNTVKPSKKVAVINTPTTTTAAVATTTEATQTPPIAEPIVQEHKSFLSKIWDFLMGL